MDDLVEDTDQLSDGSLTRHAASVAKGERSLVVRSCECLEPGICVSYARFS